MFDSISRTRVYNSADKQEHHKNTGTLSPLFYERINAFFRYGPNLPNKKEPDFVKVTHNVRFRDTGFITVHIDYHSDISHPTLLTSLASVVNKNRPLCTVEEMMDNRIERKLSVLSLMD